MAHGFYIVCFKHSGTSLLRSLTGLGKSYVNSEVTVLLKLTLCSFYYGNPFGTERIGEVTVLVR